MRKNNIRYTTKNILCENKGFSLVELIIVIAIMAILVGVMAPQLIKYIEKSKITADQRTLDAIYQAVVYASNDPNVAQDKDSQEKIALLSQTTPIKLEELSGDTLFEQEIRSTLGWEAVTDYRSHYLNLITSSHDASNAYIYIQYKGGFMNPLAMWITTTDFTGKKRSVGSDGLQDAAIWQELEDGTSDNICIK